jgi:ubiquinone/menaquinone biosynthesis C-methylase UbiE
MSNATTKNQPPYSKQMVCPWWMCFTFDNFLRRMVQHPEAILKPYIKPGWTALDVGPGMGYFTIALAKLVGENGRVIAVDVGAKMLATIHHKAVKAGVASRIVLHQNTPESIGIHEATDFCLVFWMVHEVPDRARFFSEIIDNLKPGGLMLLSEPKIHVTRRSFDVTLQIAKSAGFTPLSEPEIFLSYSVLMQK